jgi:hypothetical protein
LDLRLADGSLLEVAAEGKTECRSNFESLSERRMGAESSTSTLASVHLACIALAGLTSS